MTWSKTWFMLFSLAAGTAILLSPAACPAIASEAVVFQGPTDPYDSIIEVAFSPDGRFVAAASAGAPLRWKNEQVSVRHPYFQGGRVRLWDVTDKSTVATSGKHEGWVTGLLFTPDSHTVLSAAGGVREEKSLFGPAGAPRSAGGEVYFWKPGDVGGFVARKAHGDAVHALALSPDGQLLASASMDKTIRLWDVTERRIVRTLSGHDRDVNDLAFSPDGRLLVSASSDQSVRLWEVQTGRLVSSMRGHRDDVFDVAFSPDGQLLASGCRDRTVRLWEVASGTAVAVFEGHGERDTWPGWYRNFQECGELCQITDLAFSPDGSLLASAGLDGTVRLWDVNTRQSAAVLRAQDGRAFSLAFSPDGRLLACGGSDSYMTVWDVPTKRLLARLEGNTMPVSDVAFSPDGSLLAAGSWDGALRLWQVAEISTPAEGTTGPGGDQAVVIAITSPADGRHLRRGSELQVKFQVDPDQRLSSVNLLLDGQRSAAAQDGTRAMDLATKGIPAGDHQLEIEARLSDGRWVRSEPIHIVVVDGR